MEGNIYLIGANVVNQGTLQAPRGVVGLAAGQDVRLVDAAHPHLIVRPSEKSFGGIGVSNRGVIEALQAELVASGGNVYSLAINNEGMIRATGSATLGGRIYLVADGGKILSTGSLIAKRGLEGGDIIAYAGGQAGSSVTLAGLVDVSGMSSGGMLYVKAAHVDLSAADMRLTGGLQPAALLLSAGPHTVSITQGPTGGPFLNWPNNKGTTPTVVDDSGVVRVTEVGSDHNLHSNGTTVGVADHDNFDGFILTSADPNNPYFKDITFDLHITGKGKPDHDKSTLTFEVVTREPNGSTQTNTTTMKVAQWEALLGATDLNPRFQAVNGELIESIKITSVGIDSNGNHLLTQVFDEIKQMNSVVGGAPVVLIVRKMTFPTNSAQLFDFSVTGPSLAASFKLGNYDGSLLPPALWEPPNEYAQVVTPGTFSVTETIPAGWFLSSVAGSGASGYTFPSGLPIGPGGSGTATITLANNQTGYLIFQNTQGATITVDKVTDPVGSGQSFNFTAAGPTAIPAFALTDAALPQTAVVFPGQYTVTEAVPGTWFLDSVNIVGGSLPATSIPSGPGGSGYGQVTLAAGQSATLTFNNSEAGTIVVNKIATGDPTQSFNFVAMTQGGGAKIDQFSLVHGGTRTIALLHKGNYDIRESLPTGWFLDAIEGADVTDIPAMPGPGFGTGTVYLAAGETAGLTFRNTQGAQVIVGKTTDPAGSPQSFPFTLTGGPKAIDQSFNLTDGQTHGSGYVRPGVYAATEQNPAGWFLDEITGADFKKIPDDPGSLGSGVVTVAAGQTATMTFYNSKGARIVLNKVVDTAGAPPQTFNFQIENGPTPIIDIINLADGGSYTTPLLRKGLYDVRENVPAGWVNSEIDVVDPSGNTNHLEPFANVNLGAGEIVSLTYHNVLSTPGGRIVVSKATNPAGDPQQFSFRITDADDPSKFFSFNLADAATPFDTGPLRHGNFVVEELVNGAYQPRLNGTVLQNWDFTSVAISAVNSPVPLPPYDPTKPQQIVHADLGAEYGLVFTNTKRGEILVGKVTSPAGDATPFSFTLSGNGVSQAFTVSGAQTPYNSGYLKPGTYTVAELTAALPQSWRFTGVSVDGVVLNNPSATVTLKPGATVNVAFGNAAIGTAPPLGLFRWEPIYPDGVGRGTGTFAIETMSMHLQRAVPGEFAGDSSFHAFGPEGMGPLYPAASEVPALVRRRTAPTPVPILTTLQTTPGGGGTR